MLSAEFIVQVVRIGSLGNPSYSVCLLYFVSVDLEFTKYINSETWTLGSPWGPWGLLKR